MPPYEQPVWTLVNEDFDYVDYEHYVPDVNHHGVRLRLTLNVENQTARLYATVDNEYGTVFAESETGLEVPWHVAVALTNDAAYGFLVSPPTLVDTIKEMLL